MNRPRGIGRMALALAGLLAAAPIACKSVPADPAARPSPSPTSLALATSLPAVQPSPAATTSPRPSPSPTEEPLTARIERELAFGSPASIERAAGLIMDNRASATEFGRAILFVAARLRSTLYPDLAPVDWPLDPPRMNPLVRIMEEAEAGKLSDLALRGEGALERLLACSAIIAAKDAPTAEKVLTELSTLEAAGVSSVLIPWFRAIVAERRSSWTESMALHAATAALAPDCYPAQIGRVRALVNLGRGAEALDMLEGLRARYPENLAVLRLLARAHYAAGRMDKAGPLVMEVLRRDPANGEFILMRAHMLALQGAWLQAGPLLDAYATRNPRDPLYLLLKAQQLWKDKGQREEALAAADRGLALYPEDPRLLVLKAEILLSGSPSARDRSLARDLLSSALVVKPDDAAALKLFSAESYRAGDYARASELLEDLIAVDPAFSDWSLAIDIALASGRVAQALAWSQSWMASSPDSDAAASARLKALSRSAKEDQILSFISERLASKAGPRFRSELYYARSRLQKDQAASLSDLRAALMEDPRNVDALLAMCDFYLAQKDFRKARSYLKQAESVSPDSAGVASRRRNPDLAQP